jgi:nuclear pore complex protein Nup155
MSLIPSSSFHQTSNGYGKLSNTRLGQSQAVPKPVASLDLPAMQSASRVLHDQLLKDAHAVPELGDMLTIREWSRNTSTLNS